MRIAELSASRESIGDMTQHSSRDEAAAQLHAILSELDPDTSIDWSEVELRAITHDPRSSQRDSWRLAEGTELEQVIARLREST